LLPVTQKPPQLLRGLLSCIKKEFVIYQKTLYRCVWILYNTIVSKPHNRQFETILSLNKTTGAAGR